MRKFVITFLIFLLIINLLGCNQVEVNENTVVNNTKVDSNLEKEPEQIIPNSLPQQHQPELPGAILVMIDNNPKARPQSGLDKADIVYEILAEGGITRFLSIFYSQSAEKIGPVRSARYYFVQIAKAYNSPYAHAGGSSDALKLIPKLKISDMDEIYNAGAYFWRSKERKMPHNLYTSTKNLIEGAQAKGYTLNPLKRLPEGVIENKDKATEIEINYSKVKNYSYEVGYIWTDNQYKRLINGKPHMTLEGKELNADNVIVLEAETRDIMKDVLQSEINILDKGKALFFTQGQAVIGTWEKTTENTHFIFLDEIGSEMKFSSGKTFIQVIPKMSDIKYTYQ